LANFDDRLFARPRIFHGIRKQIREHLSHQTGIAVDRRQFADPPLNLTSLAFQLEVLQNPCHKRVQVGWPAHRHSASPWVALRLTESAAGIRLEVEDAGRGIRGRELTRGAAGEPALGVGLAGMRERIRQVGGTFAVESTGAGTRISATCPGARARARAATPP
jgi:signal transduction histidine kinase